MRPPINIKAKDRKQNQKLSTLGIGGLNLRELPQFLDVNVAQKIENYLITAEGQLYTRQGYSEYFDLSLTNPITTLTKWTNDLYVYTYGTNLAVYRISTDTHTIVKSNFVNTRFSVVKYGDYVYIANGRDGTNMQRMSFTLNFDGQTVNYTVGNTVVGGTSGATAIIREMVDAGATGTLTLGIITGTFQDNETLSDGVGNGLVNGTLNFTIQDNANAPKCEVLAEYDRKLYAGNTTEEQSTIFYCKSDDQTNPPFTNWTPGTAADAANKSTFRNLGELNSFGFQDGKVVAFYDRGKIGFNISQIDVAGTISQTVQTTWQYVDHGGISSISTPWGIFYTAKGRGVYLMLSGGQTLNQSQVANSLQEEKISKVLGDDYFEDIDLDNSHFIYDNKRQNIMLTCAKNSAVNNLILVYNIPNKTWSTITGWKINKFMVDGDIIYGTSAEDTRVFKLFDTFTDNGSPIFTTFEQEIKTDLVTLKSLEDFIIQSSLSYDSNVSISFDTWNWRGDLIPYKRNLQLTVNNTANIADVDNYTGLGSTYMGGAFGYYGESVSLYSSVAQLRARIPEFWRIRIRIKASDTVPHVINFFTCRFEQKNKQLRLNNLVDTDKPVAVDIDYTALNIPTDVVSTIANTLKVPSYPFNNTTTFWTQGATTSYNALRLIFVIKSVSYGTIFIITSNQPGFTDIVMDSSSPAIVGKFAVGYSAYIASIDNLGNIIGTVKFTTVL